MNARTPLSRVYALLALIALVGIAAIGYSVLQSRRAAARNAPPRLDVAALARLPAMTLGQADAPVTIVEFADFQCPGCAVFARDQLPRIKSELVDRGLARYVFVEYPLPFHAHAVPAARAARCAGEQDQYWDYHDQLYATQSEWAPQAEPTAAFVGYAAALGLDATRFQGCLGSDRFADEVAAGLGFARSSRVRGTPSLFVDGELVPDAFRFDDVKLRVEAAARVRAAN